MGLLENVVLMNNSNNKTVFQRIQNFLEDKKNDSEKTMIAYETDIRDFFRTVIKKEIESLTEDDLTAFDNDAVLAYKNTMVEVGYAPASINRKISSVRSLYHTLSASLERVDENVFNVSRAKGKSVKWGVLSWEETKEMMDRVMNYENGLEKSSFIEMAVWTGFRIGSIVELTWDDIRFDEKENIWTVSIHIEDNKVMGKGQKEDIKPIPTEFYEKLLQIKKSDDKVFHLSDKTMRRAIASLCEEMNIDSRRNIKFHSIKKMGVNRILDLTGDIRDAQAYANHSNGATTLNSYAMPHNRRLRDMPSLMMCKDIDTSSLNELSKEQLLAIINSCSDSVKAQIVSISQKLTGN